MTSLFRYVALGDSTAVGVGAAHGGGYPERLYQRLKVVPVPAGILNLARSGATSGELLAQQAQKAAAAKPALITVGIGTNDLWRLVPTATFAANLNALFDLLEPTKAQVVVSTLIDLRLAPIAALAQPLVPLNLVAQRIDEFNRVLFALAKRPRVEVVDLFALSHQEKHRVEALFSSDGFHPSGAGYQLWADSLWPCVERVATAWLAQR